MRDGDDVSHGSEYRTYGLIQIYDFDTEVTLPTLTDGTLDMNAIILALNIYIFY